MSWNYRVIKDVTVGDTSYGIHEVYYDANGKPVKRSMVSSIYDESHHELFTTLLSMLEALNKPTLNNDMQPIDEGRSYYGKE